jgi:dipeptidyl aminopeptidase/acylaminoacyl peptidase
MMRLENLHKSISLFIYLTVMSCMTFAQSAENLAEARAGIDVGFDPMPVEMPRLQKTTPRPITCMDLLTLRDVTGMQISPDGKYVAFVLRQAVYESNSYRTGMFVINTAEGSQPVSLGTIGPPHWDEINQWVQENPQWSPDDKYIYHTMKTSGLWQVWRWKRENGTPEQVTHVQQNVQNFFLSSDGTKLLMMLATPSTVDRKRLAEEGILYDGSFEATGQPIIDRIASTPGGENQPWVLDLTNNRAHKATETEVAELNLGTGTNGSEDPLGSMMRKIFTQKEIDEQQIFNFAVSPDHKMVAYSGKIDNPAQSQWATYPLRVRPIAGGPSVTVATWPEYPELFWWGPDSKEIYFTNYSNSNPDDPRKTKLMAVSVNGGKPRLVFQSRFFHWMYSVDRANRYAAFIREDSTTAYELEIADLSTGEMRLLAALNPEVQNLQITSAQRIDVSDKQGEHFWGHYVLPLRYQPGKRYPLVITTYADYDGFLRGSVGDEYPIHVFAANGFVVLNFNGITRKASTKADDFESTLRTWQGPLEAIEAAVTKLSDMGIVDRSRVAITGLSYGEIQVNYDISHSDLFRAGIDSGGGGSWDPIVYYLFDDELRAFGMPNLGLPTGDMLSRYKEVSGALNASSVHTPLLINASDEEYIRDMQRVNTLRALKKPVELFIYPNERHEKNQPKHRYSIYQRNVDWLNFWLNGREDSDPAKAEQYKRWHKLRTLDEKDREAAVTSTR